MSNNLNKRLNHNRCDNLYDNHNRRDSLQNGSNRFDNLQDNSDRNYNLKSDQGFMTVKERATKLLSLTLSFIMVLALVITTGFSIPAIMNSYSEESGFLWSESVPRVYADESSDNYDYDKAYEVLDLVNQARRSAGLRELKMDEDLLEAAMIRASELDRWTSHTRPDGTSFRTACSKIAYENIAWGQTTPQIVMNTWMNSWAHRNNILDGDYRTIGIGCVKVNGGYRWYWAQEFSYLDINESFPNPNKYKEGRDYFYNRFSGENRYETSMAVADSMGEKFNTVVVAYGENFADALSGSYLASINNAPMLLINKAYEASVIEYIKKKLTSGGRVYILGGTAVVSENVETSLSDIYDVKRLWGKDRYATNIEVLNEIYRTDTNNTVIYQSDEGAPPVPGGKIDCMVCSGKSFADCLSVSPINHPILLVGDELTREQREIAETGRYWFTIIGGPAAVSAKIQAELNELSGAEVRIGGKNRYETSKLVAEYYFPETTKEMFVAYGNNFPDGLSAGPLASAKSAPLILITDKQYDHAIKYAEEKGIRNINVIGGTKVISKSIAVKCVTWEAKS